MLANGRPGKGGRGGTFKEIPAGIRRGLHSLEMAERTLSGGGGEFSLGGGKSGPGGGAGVAFHVGKIAGSVDRMLTYAEGGSLNGEQTAKLKTEGAECIAIDRELAELRSALENAVRRVRALIGQDLESARVVGRELLPTSLGGLLLHVAEHTPPHVGQAITTATLVRAARVG